MWKETINQNISLRLVSTHTKSSQSRNGVQLCQLHPLATSQPSSMCDSLAKFMRVSVWQPACLGFSVASMWQRQIFIFVWNVLALLPVASRQSPMLDIFLSLPYRLVPSPACGLSNNKKHSALKMHQFNAQYHKRRGTSTTPVLSLNSVNNLIN